MFEPFVARRYLLGVEGHDEGKRFLRFVIAAAIAGVAVGVAALLIALATVRGFSGAIEDKIIGFGSHIQLQNIRDEPIRNVEAIDETIWSAAEVLDTQPVVEEFVLIRKNKRVVEGAALVGMDSLPVEIAKSITDGSASLTSGELLRPNLVVGDALAKDLGLTLGDEVVLFSFMNDEDGGVGSTRPRVGRFLITAIYETHLADYDEVYMFTALAGARKLLGYKNNEATRIDVYVDDVSTIQATTEELDDAVGFPLMARSVYEIFRPLFAWVRLQEQIIPLVIGIIAIVAAFNMIAALLMVVLEKTSDIGVLAALGASRRSIKTLFITIGLAIGVLGGLLGAGLALAFGWLQQRYEIIPLPSESYYMTSAPVELAAVDFIVVVLLAVIICGISAYIPARVAANTDPINVIRIR